jgi:sulfur dioxygenase
MLFRQLFDPDSSTYTYLLADPVTRAAVLIDPVLEQVNRDLKLLDELDLILQYCLETHIHADHVTGTAKLSTSFGRSLFTTHIHADHVTGTAKLRELTQCQSIVPANAQAACADRFIQSGEVLQLGTIAITAIATPGHTDSHMAYLVNETHVFTGDALLIRGCGRTDFQSGDPGQLYDAVTGKLFTLPDEMLVYPAHDYKGMTVSTIGEEKRFNPRFVGREREQFIELMNNLKLPDPKRMMEAVPANERCGNLAVVS